MSEYYKGYPIQYDVGYMRRRCVSIDPTVGWVTTRAVYQQRIDLTRLSIYVVNDEIEIPDINFDTDFLAFFDHVYQRNVIAFHTEEEFHMAILKYPELFTNIEVLSKEEFWR